MRIFGRMGVWATVLAVILLLSGATLVVGSREFTASPIADSFAASGSRALRETLTRLGYRVRIERSARPVLNPNDIAIRFTPTPDSDFEAMNIFDEDSDEEKSDAPEVTKSGPGKDIKAWINAGGRILELPLNDEFATASRASKQPITVLDADGKKRSINFQRVIHGWSPDSGKVAVTLLSRPDRLEAYAWLESVGKGRRAILGNGLLATNRFIAENDNADTIAWMLRRLSPSRDVVFFESEINPESKGLFESIGPWALAGWYQFLLLGAVIIWTLGVRLGLPLSEYRHQRGTRELLDGIASTLMRGRKGTMVISTVLERNRRLLCTHLKLPANTGWEAISNRLPPDMAKRIAEARAMILIPRVPEKDQLKAASDIQKAAAEFTGQQP